MEANAGPGKLPPRGAIEQALKVHKGNPLSALIEIDARIFRRKSWSIETPPLSDALSRGP
jgi:hypothetical protein